MAGGRRRTTRKPRGGSPTETPPIPLDPIDLLAGLAPGVELEADDLPPDVSPDGSTVPRPAVLTVAEAGKQLRHGDTTIRRLIRTPELQPAPSARGGEVEVQRAGVVPRTRERPGE